ncbi:hypothetical protein L208DRAFT_1383079 [Tricholoma matsutake]|nr:hypothetical protein L208DRAFT_1383079 [Tricholoma matsutake 945]
MQAKLDSSPFMSAVYQNQVGTLNSIQESDEVGEHNMAVNYNVREWIKGTSSDPNMPHDLIVLCAVPIYVNPNKNLSPSTLLRIGKHSFVDVVSISGKGTVSGKEIPKSDAHEDPVGDAVEVETLVEKKCKGKSKQMRLTKEQKYEDKVIEDSMDITKVSVCLMVLLKMLALLWTVIAINFAMLFKWTRTLFYAYFKALQIHIRFNKVIVGQLPIEVQAAIYEHLCLRDL